MTKKTSLFCGLLFCLLLFFLALSGKNVYADDSVPINESTFPCLDFRYYVRNHFDTDGDSILSPEELSSVINIEAEDSSFTSLQGIEYFTSLEYLDCKRNSLTSLDISKNTKLETLICYGNNITGLDISNCPRLQFAYSQGDCSYNKQDGLEWISRDYYWYNEEDNIEVHYLLEYDSVVSISDTTPTITSQPKDVLIAIDGTVKLTVAASGSELKYQWQYRNSSSDTWKNSTMACAKTNTFSFKAAESHSGHQYRCAVTSYGSTVFTRTATVTVRPLITKQPAASTTVPIDGTVKLTVAAKGTNLKYQWQYRNSSTDTWKNSTMACAKTATFSFTAAESHSGHQYRCVVSNSKGTVYTNAATVTVRPLITKQPQSVTVTKGTVVKLTVAAKGTNLKYQWQYRNSSTDTWKNSTMACAKTNTFTFTAAASHSGHQYRCAVSNGKGTTYTLTATLTVK